MELRQLRYFLAVAEHLSFTKAAERLRVVQPALSRQIRQLEKEIGVELLKRNNRHVALTPAGEVFRKRAIIAMDQAEAAATVARKVKQGDQRRLRIGFVTPAALDILPKLAAKFCQEMPDVELQMQELKPTIQFEALLEGKIDLGLTSMASTDVSLELRALSNKPMIIAVPSGHPAAGQTVIDLGSLSEERFLVPPANRPPGLASQIREACLDAGFMPKREMEINGALFAVFLVAAGLGVALVPQCLERLPITGVAYRPLKKPCGRLDYFAVRSKTEKSPLVEKAWNMLDDLGNL